MDINAKWLKARADRYAELLAKMNAAAEAKRLTAEELEIVAISHATAVSKYTEAARKEYEARDDLIDAYGQEVFSKISGEAVQIIERAMAVEVSG